jgi:uptake hydrogenase large subunit
MSTTLTPGQASELLVRVQYRDGCIELVEPVLQRPLQSISNLLVSQPPERAVLALPLLFAACGHAHQMAARLALAGWSVEGGALPAETDLRKLHMEALHESVLRLCQCWHYRPVEMAQPLLKLLEEGLAGDGKTPASWVDQLANAWLQFECDEWQTREWLARLADDLEDVYLPFDEDSDDVAVRVAATGTGAHIVLEQEGESVASLVREAAAALVDQARQRLDALMPESETGEWLMSFQAAVYARNLCNRNDESCGQVFTSRGWLQHRLTRNPETGQITGWWIQTPTDVNFAISGLLPQVLNGTPVAAQRVEDLVRYIVLAIDPCVAFEIEVSYHGSESSVVTEIRYSGAP